ncbi:M15 family metallopeptidase [Streptomyces sp. NPDC059193]|uniref:M15 family metallopeptidase n=1 Tax=Streptomyces sp. NPDC059193 TaxID=3346763 RepID=UPI0036ABF78F
MTSMKHRTILLVTAGVALVAGAVAPVARATTTPVTPEDFVALASVDQSIIQEMRYSTRVNFVGERVDGYQQPLCILTEPTAKALHRAQQKLLPQGYSLKVYDCYRPQRAVDNFVRWAKDLTDLRMKEEFYPQVAKDRLFADGYIAEKSGHSRGSTVDLTLVKLGTPKTGPGSPEPAAACYASQDQRRPDDSVDMGTAFDCFDPLSHTDNPQIQGIQKSNRQFLRKTLEEEGFSNLPEEWWHFTHKPESHPDTYFDFPVAYSSLPGD